MTMIRMEDNLYEFRKFLLKNLVKEGLKYIARDKDGTIFAYSCRPIRRENAWFLDTASEDGTYQNISLVSALFTDIKSGDEKPFEIPYTNWKEVPVDTPVVYIGISGKNYLLHFCKYDEKNNRVVLYAGGRTSFTENGIIETYPERVSIYKQGEKLNDGNISNNNN